MSLQILKYFSYEHFYVIYCKFWELDQDHDFLIDRDDLAHYSQGALSLQIIDRVFEQVRWQRVSLTGGLAGHRKEKGGIARGDSRNNSSTRREHEHLSYRSCTAPDCAFWLCVRAAGASPLLQHNTRQDVV